MGRSAAKAELVNAAVAVSSARANFFMTGIPNSQVSNSGFAGNIRQPSRINVTGKPQRPAMFAAGTADPSAVGTAPTRGGFEAKGRPPFSYTHLSN
jgi:hypothetical protein